MTTYAPHHDAACEARIRAAWTAYRDGLADLDGAEYEAAEEESWAHLQDELRAIGADDGPDGHADAR